VVNGYFSHQTYTLTIWAADKGTDCAAHATGAVRTFLLSQPDCELSRQLGTTTFGGHRIG